jgi:hypothetical protein
MKKTKTDCRSREGITVGLIDSLISISRVLRKDLKSYYEDFEERYRKDEDNNYIFPNSILEALKDLQGDEDLYVILQTGNYNPRILSEEDRGIIDAFNMIKKMTEENNK